MDGGLMIGGLLFALIGLYLFGRSKRLTALSFEANRDVLRRVLGDARTDRLLSPSFERANVLYGRGFGLVLAVDLSVSMLRRAANEDWGEARCLVAGCRRMPTGWRSWTRCSTS